MSLSIVLLALGLGLAGSLHCAGMCGPLLVSISLCKKNKNKLYKDMFMHHTGRITAYTIMGLTAGSMGRVFSAGGLQQKISIACGITLLLIFLIPHFLDGKSKFTVFLKRKWASLINKSGYTNSYLIGIINGLLPCGLVYAALAAATASGASIYGALFMMLFGVGTLPLLLLITFGGVRLNLSAKAAAGYVLPLATLITAALLILRGMNLGIPYISPTVENSSGVSCCHQDNQ